MPILTREKEAKSPVFTIVSLWLGFLSLLISALAVPFMGMPMGAILAFGGLQIGFVLGGLTVPCIALALARNEQGRWLALLGAVPWASMALDLGRSYFG